MVVVMVMVTVGAMVMVVVMVMVMVGAMVMVVCTLNVVLTDHPLTRQTHPRMVKPLVNVIQSASYEASLGC